MSASAPALWRRAALATVVLLSVGLLVTTGATSASAQERTRPAGTRPVVRVPDEPTLVERLAGKQRRRHVLPAPSGEGRRVVYSIHQQRVWLVGRDESVRRTYAVSGQLSQPGSGTYRVYSRSRHARSAVSPETMTHMVRFAHGRHTGAPIGFHSIPVHLDGTPAQTLAQLGQPLSSGCVRQKRSDAVALWRFAPVGTKVVVVR